MGSEWHANEKASPGRMFLPSLSIASFAVSLSGPILGLLTVDMAKTFFGSASEAAVGATSQIGTVNSAAEVIFALMMGALAVRFRHKSLLLVGVLLVVVSAVGGFFAPTLGWLQLFFALEGGGTIMVGIMIMTLIGELLPFSKKAKGVGYITAATSVASLAALFIIGLVTNFGGWRSVLLFFMMPVSVASFVLVFLALPSRTREQQPAGGNTYLKSFKQVLLNKSAVSCIFASMLASASGMVVFIFAFYRTQFLIEPYFTTFTALYFTIGIMASAALIFIAASLTVGRIANKVGAKKLVIVGALGTGIITPAFFFMSNLWVAFTVHMVGLAFGVLAGTAYMCLALDQVPDSRGTMLSVNAVFGNIGGVIGTAVGGLMLILLASYQAVGIAVGAFSIASAVVVFLLVKQPTGS